MSKKTFDDFFGESHQNINIGSMKMKVMSVFS